MWSRNVLDPQMKLATTGESSPRKARGNQGARMTGESQAHDNRIESNLRTAKGVKPEGGKGKPRRKDDRVKVHAILPLRRFKRPGVYAPTTFLCDAFKPSVRVDGKGTQGCFHQGDV